MNLSLEKVLLLAYAALIIAVGLMVIPWILEIAEVEKHKAYGELEEDTLFMNASNFTAVNASDPSTWPWCTEDTPVDTYCMDPNDGPFTREVRGTGSSPTGEYDIRNCSGEDCVDADKETKQEEEAIDDSPAYVPPSDDEKEEEENDDKGDEAPPIKHGDFGE